MSKHKVVIEPKSHLKAELFLAFSYFNRPTATNFCLTIDGEVIETKLGEPIPERRRLEVFNKSRTRFQFEWDDENTDDKGTVMRAFLLQHNNVECDTYKGNANMNAPQFKMIDYYSENRISYDRLTGVASMTAEVLAMEAKDLADILFYFGLNPSGMSHREMLLKLLGEPEATIVNGQAVMTGGGVLLEYNANSDRSEEYRKVFKDLTAESRMTINIKKAIALKLILMDGAVFKFEGEILGNSVDSVIAYYKNNPDRYEKGLKPKVEQSVSDVYSNDLDLKPEKPNIHSFEPKKMEVPANKPEFTQADLDQIEREIKTLEQDVEMRKNRSNEYIQKMTNLQMRRNKIRAYLTDQSTKKAQKEAGTFVATDKLKKQGDKKIKKETEKS